MASRRVVPPGPEARVPRPPAPSAVPAAGTQPLSLEVKLPGGGTLDLQTPAEVVMWNEASKRYVADYRLTKANDLILLGAILSQILSLYRAQRDMADPKKGAAAQLVVAKAAEEIRKGEKALGIDKATRERGGQHTIADYLTRLKKAGFEKGVHISERTKSYEAFTMELRWKLRLLRNGDTEDRAYHGLTERSLLEWAEAELAKLEEKDKEWAKEKAAVWVGKL